MGEKKKQLHHKQRKTVQMVFRRGGRVATKDKLKLKAESLRIVNKFKYLGITVQPTVKSHSVHIQERKFGSHKSNVHNTEHHITKTGNSHEAL